MPDQKPKMVDFDAALHNENYDAEYLIPPVSPDDLFTLADRKCESLDGQWGFAIDPYENGMRKKWFNEITADDAGFPLPMDFDFDAWESIAVPACFNTQQKEFLFYEGMTWYTRRFYFVPDSEKPRVFMRFGGANYECRVWLNRKLIARHLGGSTPFAVEVTDYLQRENRLLVMVSNRRRPENVPALNTDWFNYGGLYRSVGLYRMPKSFIKDLFVRLVPDGEMNKIAVSVKVEGNARDCTVSIPGLGLDLALKLQDGEGECVVPASPELWSPESPKLYSVTARCEADVLSDEVGFKDFRAQAEKVLLNGKRIFLRGISMHEDSADVGKSLRAQDIEKSFAIAKELGCNFIRLAHYPHSDMAARIADRVGLLVWEEVPVYWTILFGNPATYQCAQNQLKELILRDRGRVSVCVWSVGNENPDNDERLEFMKGLIDTCRSLDDTRLVSAACLVNYKKLAMEDRLAEFVDIVGINEYYGWYRHNMEDLPRELANLDIGKPVMISEMGADALAGHHGSRDELFTEECQEYVYERQIEILSRFAFLCGLSPWILCDFRTPRRQNGFQRGWNLKGLVTADRNYKKKAFFTLQKFYHVKAKQSE